MVVFVPDSAQRSDVVNGCQYHPYLKLLATTSGQRKFAVVDEEETEKSPQEFENSLKIWALE